jgi:LysR family transcriptional regulator of gallate degradation
MLPHADNLPRILHLLAFDKVATGGSMRHAADALHLTQPAITYAIHALERRLGTTLLTRGRGGSFLTRGGALLARRTTRLSSQLRAAVAHATGLDPAGDEVSRMLRLITDSQLRALVAIEAAQSFRGAAQALGIAEPSLHRPARDIEHILRIMLYRRNQGGLALSPAGAELARRLLLVTAEIRAGLADIAGPGHAAEATIAIGVLPLAPKARPAQMLQSLLVAHPGLRASLLEGGYDDLVRDLRRGTIDLVFGALRAPPPFPDLAEQPMFRDPYVIVARGDHALARRVDLTPDALSSYGWVFPTPSLPRRAVLDSLLVSWGITPDIQLQTNSIGAIAAAVMASDRLSLWPRSSIEAEPHFAALTVLDIEVPQTNRVVGLTHRQDWLPTRAQADFLERFLACGGGDNAALG